MQEPPTPLRNADFRSLLATTPRPVQRAPATPSHPLPSSSGSAPPLAAKSSKRREHYERHLAKQAARQQQRGDGGAHGSDGGSNRSVYRDRAAERRSDANPDYDNAALPAAAADVSEETSKFLGGDEEHTHLVKGLDYALLQRRREEEERRQQQRLDELAQPTQPSGDAAAVTPELSLPPAFRSLLAQAVYELLQPPPVAASDLFLPGRLSYVVTLPPLSPFPLLPRALAASASLSSTLLASLNELPTSVLVSKDDLPAAPTAVSAFVPPAVLQRVRDAMEKRRERKRRKKQLTETAAASAEGKDAASEDDDGARTAETRREEPVALSLEERRRRLMEADDEDIFGGAAPAPAAPPAVAALVASTAVFKPAAPSSRYFHTAEPPLPFTTSPPSVVEGKAADAPPSSTELPLSAAAPSSVFPRSPRSSLPSLHDEYDELYPDAAMSFSGHLAGDEDSDDEAEALKEKERAREEKMQAKRGGRRRGGGGRGGAGAVELEQKREEKRREAKIDSQLAVVTELLSNNSGKLRLEVFEREAEAQETAKRLKRG